MSDNNWAYINITNEPRLNRSYSIDQISGTDKFVLFGWKLKNMQSPWTNETWIFDLSEKKWTQMFPKICPRHLSYRSITHIHGTDKVLLLGSYYNTNNFEIWIYDLSNNNWSYRNISSIPRPSVRVQYEIVGLPGTDKLLLYGKYGNYTNLNDTWIYDFSENNWSKRD
ncbi:unnamed protein product, partial [marine sediment metagenome]